MRKFLYLNSLISIAVVVALLSRIEDITAALRIANLQIQRNRLQLVLDHMNMKILKTSKLQVKKLENDQTK